MRNLKPFIAALGGTVVALAASAQTPGDLLRLSQYNYSFGTARSAAMGGAFTSLGADLSSMSINPAGLGMYRTSEVGFSPSVTSSTLKSNYLGTGSSDSKTMFSVGNLSAVFNLHQGSGTLTSFSLGVGYNKMADFNTNSLAHGWDHPSSIVEIFAENMNGVPLDRLNSGGDPYRPFRNVGLDRWGGVLAYQAGVLNPVNDHQYSAFAPAFNDPDVGPVLSDGSTTNPILRNISKGSIGEYTISGGLNFKNLIYVGMTIGIQDIYYKNQNNYLEEYNNNPLTLNNLNYIQQLKVDGTGVNVKLGVTVRPTDNLRIGLAVHTPTFIDIKEEYVEYMSTNTKTHGQGTLLDSPYALNEYTVQTPTRLLAGVSYTLPGVGLITADYERVWYNKMQLKDMDDALFESSLREDVERIFRPANNFRAGVEITPIENFYLRAGYAYYDNCQRDKAEGFINQENIRSWQNYSGGLGFRFDAFYVDVAYIYSDYKYADSRIYNFDGFDTDLPFNINSGDISTKQNRHTVTLSVGVKF